MTKKLTTLLAAAFSLLAAAPALAGGTTWSGLYIGASVGYGVAKTDTVYQNDSTEFDFDPSDDFILLFIDAFSSPTSDGITGTGTVGYDREVGNGIVLGVFADYTVGALEGDFKYDFQIPNKVTFGVDHDIRIDNMWSVGGRVGVSPSCCALWYVMAGYTQADFELKDNIGFVGNRENTLEGYFVGGGVEQSLISGMSLKLEYRYSDFGGDSIYDTTYFRPCPGAGCTLPNLQFRERLEAETQIHSIRLGLAYKFNFDGVR